MPRNDESLKKELETQCKKLSDRLTKWRQELVDNEPGNTQPLREDGSIDAAVLNVAPERVDRLTKELRAYEAVIRRINAGCYGICEECGDRISEKRLQKIPETTFCIKCKENQERQEQMERGRSTGVRYPDIAFALID